jgi:hypothetical protein
VCDKTRGMEREWGEKQRIKKKISRWMYICRDKVRKKEEE